MEDSDSEYEVEESVILVELNGIIDANFLLQEQKPTKVLGIDTDKPILQIGHYIFSGEYEHTTGTVVVYQPVDSSKTDAAEYDYLCKTDTKLTMKRIFIKEKTDDKVEIGEEVSCTLPIRKGEPAPTNSPERLNNSENDCKEKIHPETHPEILSVENNIARASSNFGENELQGQTFVQKLDPPSMDPPSISDSKKGKATLKLPSKKKVSKSIILENTLRPEESLSLKNKGQKRKRSVIAKNKSQHDVDTNLVESGSEDIEQVPCNSGKQIKVQIDGHDSLQREASNEHGKDETEMHEEKESIVHQKGESMMEVNVEKEYEIDTHNKDEPIMEKKDNCIVHETDEPNLQERDTIDIQNKNEPAVQEKEESIMQLQEEFILQGRNELTASSTSEISLNDTANQENVLVYNEAISVCSENNSGADINAQLPREITNEAASQNESVENPSIDFIEVHPSHEVVNVEAQTIYSDGNGNSEAVNQLVESSTDKMLVSDTCISVDEVRGDGNCSSSGDTVYPISGDIISSDICQSSDNKNIPKISLESIEKCEDNGASSSTLSRNSSIGEGNVEEGIVSEDSLHSKSVQTDLLKATSCEVSQSLDDENRVSINFSEVKDSNECEISASPVSPTGHSSRVLEEGILNTCEGSSSALEVSISSESQLVVEDVESTKRKLSSCEVTQSNSSEREFPGTPDEASECEVFSQNPLHGIENIFNASTNEAMGPFGLVAGSSDEVEYLRRSLASESSTSEVSQSHRSVIQESQAVEERDLEDLTFTDGAVCSQSSDQINDLNETSIENKGLCVSSCDVSKDKSIHNESIELDKTTRNTGCEVSQSDKSNENTNSKNEEDEKLLSNECDAPSHVLDGNLVSPSINQSGNQTLTTLTKDSEIATTSRGQMACEVSQSFSSSNNASDSEIDLHIDNKLGSNECDNYENSGPSNEVLNDDSNNNCVSSDDIIHFIPLQEEVSEEREKDPVCEVSQSFRSRESIVLLEHCGSSSLTSGQVQRNLNTNEPESRNSCEVTQSLELEGSSVSELYEDEDDSINECERSNLNLDIDQSGRDGVDQSDDYVEEICESSDDVIIISNDESNSQSEQVQPLNYSNCEVSQSYRLEDGILIPQAEQFFDVGVESSNECEVYASSVSSAPEYNINRSDSDEKNVCESSDDIERSSADIKYSSQHSKSDFQEACQSTKCDGNFTYDAAKAEFSENNSSEYEAGNEASNLTDDEINVCESSEDVNVNELSSELNSGACSSSDKLFKKPTDNNKMCDSLSNQAIAGPSTEVSLNELEGNLVSSNSSLRDSVKVSSSVDSISSNFVDVIYSSSNVSNSTVSSNSEISQSSARKGPYVWSGNLLSAPSSSNSNIDIVADVSSDEHFAAALSGDANVQSTASDSILALEASNATLLSGSPMSSSRNNEAIESSISSSSASGNRIKKHILKVKKSYVSAVNMDTSQSTSTIKEQNRESVILGGNCSHKSDLSDSPSTRNHPEVDSLSQQLVSQHENIPQFERSTNSDPRPSLLEVMVSSASDFRNSLLYDSTSFCKDANHSSVVESSSSNVRPSYEFSESHICEVTGHLSEASGNVITEVIIPESFPVENSDSVVTEVSESLEGEGKYESSSGSSGSRQQVSQSSDIVNTHSSTSQTQAVAFDGISESFRPDYVQSSSQISKIFLLSTEAASLNTGSETNNLNVSDNSKKIESPESSSTQISLPTLSGNRLASENSVHCIESSSEAPSPAVRSRIVDSEVSSTPSNIHHFNPEVLSMDGSDQCSFIEGNVVLLPGSGAILNRPEDEVTQVDVISAHTDFVPFQDGGQLLIQTSNEADTLNRSLVFSSSAIQIPLHEEIDSLNSNVAERSVFDLETEVNVSTTPGNEVIVIAHDGDHSSEISESLVSEQNDLSQSVLADNNVSCSAVEFSLNNDTFDKKYSFNEGEFSGTSREAESKSEDGISSYQSVCDNNILPVPNLSSAANTELSMYSHIGEFEDSIQSSSLDATHFSINEQIKAISSPPTFSNSESSEEQVPTSINAFTSFSESHNLPSMPYSLPSISSIPTSFMAEGISSRLQTEAIIEDKSILIGERVVDIDTRSSVLKSPNTTYTQEQSSPVDNEVSESGSRDDLDESSQISEFGGTENSPEEYEVLSEYEEIENAGDDSNAVDSSNE